VLALRQLRFRSGSRLVFESALVVLSIVLGFTVSEWRQASADRDLATRMLRNVRTEIEHNLARIEARLPRHQKMIAGIASADVSDSRMSAWDVIFAKLKEHGGGLDVAVLPEAAWDAAVSTGALRLIEYDIAAALSEIYGGQALLMRAVDHLFDSYQPAIFEAGKQREGVQMFHWLLIEIEGSERAVRDLYRKHLPKIQAATGP
jgi:hypothetical protein